MDSVLTGVTETSDLWETLASSVTLHAVLYALLTLVIGLIVVRVVTILLRKALRRARADGRIVTYAVAGVRFALLTVVVLIAADQLGIPITSLVALLSVLSLAITLAVQTVLSNVAGGLVMVATRPFSVGDIVTIGGDTGVVEEIRLTHTCIDTVSGTRIILPNGTVASEKVTNLSVLGKRRVEVAVSASYDAPVSMVRKACLEAVAAVDHVLSDPAPAVLVTSYGESSIAYLVLCWCKPTDYLNVYYPLTEALRESFLRNNVEMTYNHLNVHIIDTPERMKEDEKALH